MLQSSIERKGTLQPEQVFKTATGDVWYVDYVSASGAYCIHLSGRYGPITTRKGISKTVKRHLPNTVFSIGSIVDLIDPSKLDSVQLRRRIAMARKEGAVVENEAATTETKPAAEPKIRITQKYVRTEKTPAKELRGQAKETLAALDASGGTPMSAKEVADLCKYEGSRQDKERVAGFYLSQFKKDGLVKVFATDGQ